MTKYHVDMELSYIKFVVYTFLLVCASTTSVEWLTTCVLTVLVEAFIQQPASLLATGILGDFIEEGANLLVDLL